MAEVEEKARAFTEAHKGESAEDILAQMRGEEPQCSQASHASVSDDLEKAAEQYAYDIAPSIGATNTEIELSFKAGANWQREQIAKRDKTLDYYTFENGEKHFAQYILEMIANGWHMEAIKSACKDKIMEK